MIPTSMNRSGTSCGSSMPKTLSHTSPGVVVDGCPVVTISPSEVVLRVVGASVVVVGTVKVKKNVNFLMPTKTCFYTIRP